MNVEDYFDFLAPNDIRLKGHRIGIESILYEYIHNEKTPKEIVEHFPTLTIEQIYAAMLFYHHNKDQLDQYLKDWLEHGELMRAKQAENPNPTILKLRKAKAEKQMVALP